MSMWLGARNGGWGRGAFGGSCGFSDLGSKLRGVPLGQVGYLLQKKVDGNIEMCGSMGRVSSMVCFRFLGRTYSSFPTHNRVSDAKKLKC